MRFSKRSEKHDVMRLTLTIAVLAAMLSGEARAGETDIGAVSFSTEITPLLTRRCAVCHITGEEPGELALVPGSAYASLVDIPSQQSTLLLVDPGEPAKSYLYHKLAGSHVEAGGEGARMPFASPPLPDAQLQLVRRWIQEGALDN
ncbi:MAG: hypothetical protein ACNA7T_12065 [Haliea sp.]